MPYTKEELEQMAQSVPYWWHSIDLGKGVVTKGHKSAEGLQSELKAMRLPNLQGKTVLDIGAWDGFYSFEAERSGAKRVVALDHYDWALDLPNVMAYWRECNELGISFDPENEVAQLNLRDLPGMLGYKTAHRALGSKVETVVEDFMESDPNKLGTFDVVLYLGVLYHMQNPLLSLQRLAALTKGMVVIETEAIALPGNEQRAYCEFFEGTELNGDSSNWWAPNERAVAGMCRAAGFKRVETIVGSPVPRRDNKSPIAKLKSVAGFTLREFGLRKKLPEVVRFRAVVHAWK
jgi:tRNA (mo5U34)-methyltransferase